MEAVQNKHTKKKNMVYIIHLIQLVARKKEHQKLYHLESRWRNSHESWFIMAPYPNPPYLGVASHLLSKWYTHDIPTSTPCLIYSVTINKLREPLAFPLRISVEPRQNRTIFGWFNCESLRTWILVDWFWGKLHWKQHWCLSRSIYFSY